MSPERRTSFAAATLIAAAFASDPLFGPMYRESRTKSRKRRTDRTRNKIAAESRRRNRKG